MYQLLSDWAARFCEKIFEIYIYVKVSQDLEYLIFFLKKILWGPMKVKFRHLWLRWS